MHLVALALGPLEEASAPTFVPDCSAVLCVQLATWRSSAKVQVDGGALTHELVVVVAVSRWKYFSLFAATLVLSFRWSISSRERERER